MTKRTTRRSSAAALLESPSTTKTSPTPSPLHSPPIQFKLNTDPSNNSHKTASKPTTTESSPSPRRSLKRAATISDLKDLSSSTLDSMKRHLERSRSEALKDVDAWRCRFRKRIKAQAQACEQLRDELEKQYKKISELINEGPEDIKLIAETRATALADSNEQELVDVENPSEVSF